MTLTQKITAGICFVVFTLATGISGYYYGTQKQSQEVQALRAEQLIQARGYADSIATIQNERDRALNDYQTSCLEYQKLRTAYDLLYDKTGATSGQPPYSSPDDARGNEESCYR